MAPSNVLSASYTPMINAVAPSDCRYFGTKRIHVSSPAPIATMAMSSSTRLRLRPKNSPSPWRAGCTLVVSLAALAQLVERRLEARCESCCRAAAPVVQEVDGGLGRGHVMMHSDHVDAVSAQRLQYRRDLVREHGHVARDCRVLIRSDECGPCVQPHPRIDGRAHFFDVQVVATDRDLVDRPVLFTRVTDDLR